MAKNTKDKPVRPRALPAKGFRDYFGSAVIKRYDMLATIGKIYHRYGFAPLESSAVETVEALGKFLPDTDRPNDGVFAWQDEDDGWLALRYDLTAPLARVFAQHRNDLPLPYRRYAMGPVWRNEKIGAGRYRQFYQCDADTVGASSPAADAEICMMLADVLEAVGIARNDYQIRLNSRKILNGVLDSLELLDADVRGGVLRTIDKFDKIGESGVRSLLTKGRLDKSGAFIDGVGLSSVQADGVLAFLMAKGEEFTDTLNNIGKILNNNSEEYVEGVKELLSIISLVRGQGYESDRIVFDPSVVRGLGYYTGAVYEAELTFEIKDKKGRVRQFGSVAGGGRYDDLIKRFTGQSIPATGVSVGVDRLLAALEERGGDADKDVGYVADGPVLVTVMDKHRIGDYQAMVTELRNKGVKAELYLGNAKNFGNQLKYADMRGSPLAIIQGSDELARGKVQIKNLEVGAQLSKEIDSLEEWRTNPSQITIDRKHLAGRVERFIRTGDLNPKTAIKKSKLLMTRARIADKANQLQRKFLQTGAELVDVDMFLPAKRLLKLYGEDIRARTYITEDSINILRPDFTVPIVESHRGKAGDLPFSYCYNGLVWRKQGYDSIRPREFRQVGIEVFGNPDPSLAEADIFALFFDILKTELRQNPSVVTGDIGLLRAAINGLNTTTVRRRALLRHLWHPKRFNHMLKRFSGNTKSLASRNELIEQVKEKGFDQVIDKSGYFIGKRSMEEIRARVDILIKESETSMLDGKETGLIDAILALNTNAADALKQVQEWERNYSCLSDAFKQMEARFKAFEDKGIDLKSLDFKGNYGLTDLEYYDGFVFRFTDTAQNILATGGRYDALVKRLGRKKLNAIGGVIYPDILLQAMEG